MRGLTNREPYVRGVNIRAPGYCALDLRQRGVGKSAHLREFMRLMRIWSMTHLPASAS